jgi:cytochrome c-type biogenesis protein CcmH/NrfF
MYKDLLQAVIVGPPHKQSGFVVLWLLPVYALLLGVMNII